ncbi:MAG: calcium-binding protein, partial [Reyranellaceae bacterium]
EAGFDQLGGGNGSDTIHGGAFAPGDTVGNVLYGDDGADSLIGGSGSDTLYGGTGNDVIWGDGFWGGTGAADTLSGDLGDDTIYAGEGDDTILFSADKTLSGASSGVRLWDGSSNTTTVYAGSATWSWSSDQLFGGFTWSDSGTDTLVLTGGNDVLVLDSRDILSNGTWQTAAGNRLNYIEVILAGAGADVVALNSSGDAHYSLPVTLVGESGNDILYSGTGADTLVGGFIDGTIDTSGDTLAGGGGDDVLWGDSLFDTTSTTGGNDTLFGGTGSDTLHGGGGDDVMYGGSTDGSDDGYFDTYFGGAGNDQIFDASNAATVYGDAGDDTIDVAMAWGNATLFGGSGNDVFYANGTYSTLYAYGGDGDDWFIFGDTTSATWPVDIVDGGAGDDVISIFNGNDTAYGGSGTDVIWGGGGSDTLYGGDDADYLYGGEGNNVLAGGNGADWYYVSKGDGPTTLIDTGARDNNLVLFGQFDTSGSQLFVDGTGVNETPSNGAGTPLAAGAVLGASVGGEIDLSINGTTALLSVAGGSTVQFSTADIATITLWNNDASAGHEQEVFNWSAAAGTYVFAGYF